MNRNAKVELTPEMMSRLQAGEAIVVNIPPNVNRLTVSVRKYDASAHFDSVFDNIWSRLLRKLEKAF